MRSIIYVTYNGVLEQIAQSQIIPYLRDLAKEGNRFVLLSFEKSHILKNTPAERLLAIKKDLMAMGIEWHWLRYHKRFPLLATSFDIFQGMVCIAYLTIRRRVQIVHARSIVPATMALISKFFGARLIFDTRGLLAEEYAGGGHWRESSLSFKITKFFERLCYKLSDSIVILTKRHYEYLSNASLLPHGNTALPIEVIPCCVDLDRFNGDLSQEKAESLKKKENIHNSFIFTYLGKLGKHYMLSEMLELFKASLSMLPNAKFMLISQDDPHKFSNIISNRGVSLDRIIFKRPPFDEIPYLLSLARAGIFFINPYKKFGSSPIKMGEFLSCGVPVVINSGIGDTRELVEANRVGVVIDRFDDSSYNRAISGLLGLLDEGDVLRQRCRKTAEDFLSLESGVRKYSSIYNRLC